MRKFITFGPALVVLIAAMVTLVAAPAAVRQISYAGTDATIRLARQSLDQDDVLERINKAVRNIADTVEPSVVHISVDEPSFRGVIRVSQGSGWVYDAAGHIVTNAHVVRGANRINVQFQDGRQVGGTLVGLDPTTDIAVIQARTDEGLFPAQRASGIDLHQGDRVYAFGSPFGFKFSMSEGIVSGLGRDPRTVIGQEGYTNFIQTDAAVNPGNSGGPLVDIRGRVVGMNVAIATGKDADGTTEGQSSGISFAIPLATIEFVADQLISGGTVSKGFLGIEHPQTDERNAAALSRLGYRGQGVYLANVPEGEPAAKAGLLAGDVITQINGRRITNIAGLRTAIANNAPGDTVHVEVSRQGKLLDFEVALGERGLSRMEAVEALASTQRLGLGEVAQLADGSIIVDTVLRPSAAFAAGFKPGQKIVSVAGRKPANAVEFYGELMRAGLLRGTEVEIGVIENNGESKTLKLGPQ